MKNAPTDQGNGAPGEQLSFIDPPPFCPTLPTPNTKPDYLLRVLLTGARVTQPMWLDMDGSWRLSATAKVLQVAGWPVESARIPAPCSTNPNRCIASYALPQAAVAAGRELVRNARGGE